MNDIILTLISSFFSGIFIIVWGHLLYNIKKVKIKWYFVLAFLIYTFAFTYSAYYFSSLLHIGIIILSTLILHQIFFRKSFSEICAGVVVINAIKLVFILFYNIIIRYITILYNYDYYWLGVLIIHFLTTVIILLFYKSFTKIIKKYDIYNYDSWKSIIILNFSIIIIFMLEISFFQDSYSLNIIVPIVSILYLFLQIYKFVYQKVALNCYLTNYYEISKFSKFMENIIDCYKEKLYDTKSQLCLLKDKLDVKDPSVISYIDNLIEEKSHINYSWLASLCNFNLPGIKGFLSYKIQEMMELDIEIELFISDTLENIIINSNDWNLKDIYIIIGVLCDNAKEAAVNSSDKVISIQAYYEDNTIHFLIANSYIKTVPLLHIDDIGVTNKKGNYGTGLYIVKSIINKNHKLGMKTTIMNDFFIQELAIMITENA